MYSAKSFSITKDEYYYLKPAVRQRVGYVVGYMGSDDYFLVANSDNLADSLNRLKGFHDYFDEIPSSVVLECQKVSSIEPFRKYIKC